MPKQQVTPKGCKRSVQRLVYVITSQDELQRCGDDSVAHDPCPLHDTQVVLARTLGTCEYVGGRTE